MFIYKIFQYCLVNRIKVFLILMTTSNDQCDN